MFILFLVAVGFLFGSGLVGLSVLVWYKKRLSPVLGRFDLAKRELYKLKELVKDHEANALRLRNEKVGFEDRYIVADKSLQQKMKKAELQEKEIDSLKLQIAELGGQVNTVNALLTQKNLELEGYYSGNLNLKEFIDDLTIEKNKALQDLQVQKDENVKIVNESNLDKIEFWKEKDLRKKDQEKYLEGLKKLTDQRDLALTKNSELLFKLRRAVADLEDLSKNVHRPDVISRLTELIAAVLLLGGGSGDDKEAVVDFLEATGQEQKLHNSKSFEDVDVFNRETAKLEPINTKQLSNMSSQELAGAAETVKLVPPPGTAHLFEFTDEDVNDLPILDVEAEDGQSKNVYKFPEGSKNKFSLIDNVYLNYSLKAFSIMSLNQRQELFFEYFENLFRLISNLNPEFDTKDFSKGLMKLFGNRFRDCIDENAFSSFKPSLFDPSVDMLAERLFVQADGHFKLCSGIRDPFFADALILYLRVVLFQSVSCFDEVVSVVIFETIRFQLEFDRKKFLGIIFGNGGKYMNIASLFNEIVLSQEDVDILVAGEEFKFLSPRDATMLKAKLRDGKILSALNLLLGRILKSGTFETGSDDYRDACGKIACLIVCRLRLPFVAVKYSS
jgi:hypothetical protein